MHFYTFSHIVHTKTPENVAENGSFQKTNFKTHRFEKVTFEGWIDDENEGL